MSLKVSRYLILAANKYCRPAFSPHHHHWAIYRSELPPSKPSSRSITSKTYWDQFFRNTTILDHISQHRSVATATTWLLSRNHCPPPPPPACRGLCGWACTWGSVQIIHWFIWPCNNGSFYRPTSGPSSLENPQEPTSYSCAKCTLFTFCRLTGVFILLLLRKKNTCGSMAAYNVVVMVARGSFPSSFSNTRASFITRSDAVQYPGE